MISDTHGAHRQLANVPEGDVLIHAGDCCSKDTVRGDPTLRKAGNSLIDFLDWFGSLPHPVKILVAGNHDTPFTGRDWFSGKPLAMTVERARQCCANAGVLYLEHQELLIDRLRVFGTPWQPHYKSMAFNADDAARRRLFGQVPQGIDILVSHCPPAGVLDVNDKQQSCGCPVLAEHLETIDPRLHVFGHIHKSAGTVRDGDRISVNAALPGEKFTLSNPPTVVDLTV